MISLPYFHQSFCSQGESRGLGIRRIERAGAKLTGFDKKQAGVTRPVSRPEIDLKQINSCNLAFLRRCRRPALDERVVIDRFALWLFIRKLALWRNGACSLSLLEPLFS